MAGLKPAQVIEENAEVIADRRTPALPPCYSPPAEHPLGFFHGRLRGRASRFCAKRWRPGGDYGGRYFDRSCCRSLFDSGRGPSGVVRYFSEAGSATALNVSLPLDQSEHVRAPRTVLYHAAPCSQAGVVDRCRILD